MVETDYNIEDNGIQNVRQHRAFDTNNRINSAPVEWIGRSNGFGHNVGPNASNTGCPIKVDTSHPLWQTFLDSGTVSPLAFFRIFLSPPTYFNNPTPWRRSTRFVQKVQELLESFRPGTYIYQPFQKESASTITSTDLDELQDTIDKSLIEEHDVSSNQVSRPSDERHNSIIEEYGVSRSLSNPLLIPLERISSIPDVDSENHNHDTQVASTQKNDSLHSENIPNNEDKEISEIADDNISLTRNISNSPINLVLSEQLTRHRIKRKLRDARLSNFKKRNANSNQLSDLQASDQQSSKEVSHYTLRSSHETENVTNYTLLNRSSSTNHLDIELDEDRQRLYVDTGRPRPFRRLYDDNIDNGDENSINENVAVNDITIRSYQESHVSLSNVSNHHARDLEDLAKLALVKRLGLAGLHEAIYPKEHETKEDAKYLFGAAETMRHQFNSFNLPQVLKDKMLTFLCDDFEEITTHTELDGQEKIDDGVTRNIRGTGSFKVRCVHDAQIYTASFFTSEVDKEVSNIWEEFREYLILPNDIRKCMVEVLAVVADPLTQNVFLVTKSYPTNIRQHIAAIKSYSEKDTNESRRNGEDLMNSTIVALKECLDNSMQVHSHNNLNYIHTCCKENILNKDVIQRTSLAQLMDQLLVSHVSSENKYLRKLDYKPTFTVHIDNPLLSKNWRSPKMFPPSAVFSGFSTDIFEQLMSYISNL